MMEAAGRFRFSHGENAVEPCACVQLKELRLAKVHADSASGRRSRIDNVVQEIAAAKRD
jgi:hypothetical protein